MKQRKQQEKYLSLIAALLQTVFVFCVCVCVLVLKLALYRRQQKATKLEPQ